MSSGVGVAVEQVGVDVHVKFGNSRPNRSRDIRAAHFVIDDDDNRQRSRHNTVTFSAFCSPSPPPGQKNYARIPNHRIIQFVVIGMRGTLKHAANHETV